MTSGRVHAAYGRPPVRRQSMIVMDVHRRVTTSYSMNRMAPGIVGSPRAEAYIDAVSAVL